MDHRGRRALAGVCALAALGATDARAHDSSSESGVVLAPGYTTLEFEAPPPGSYALPPLGEAANASVLDERGRPQQLSALFGDKVVLLSFVYTSCGDVNGCPLSMAVMHRLSRQLAELPDVAGNARLVTLSFDPARDTPEVMRRYAESFRSDRSDWRFLTTASHGQLAPILADYDQPVQVEVDGEGHPTGQFAHILRVFLIDKLARIRNVYSASFLHADLLLNDVRTLLLEDRGEKAAQPGVASAQAVANTPYRAGDAKDGYQSVEYVTHSLSLEQRRGESADLASFVRRPPLGLPAVPVPEDNPVTPRKVELGRKLFFDRRLSLNQTISCALCHVPEQGFTSQEVSTAVGIEGRTVRRNSPTLYNVAYARRLFHDGRENKLEQQIWGPLLASNEMGNPSVAAVLDKIAALPDYEGLFPAAFAGRGPSMETLGMALASYQRTLLSGNSAFDRWRFGGEEDAQSPAAVRGFHLFSGKARCATCHVIQSDHAVFTDHGLHNTGIGFRRSMAKPRDTHRLQVAPGTFLDVDGEVVASVSEAPPNDLGRYEITQDPADRWKYKTPGLRNVGLTAPYMHDGSLGTLREVVEFYNGGGVPNETLDLAIRPMGLSAREIDDLVAFLESLTGDNVDVLVADAFAAPVGDP